MATVTALRNPATPPDDECAQPHGADKGGHGFL